MDDNSLLLFSIGTFVSIAAMSFVLLSIAVTRTQVRQRISTGGKGGAVGLAAAPSGITVLAGVNERYFAVAGAKLTRLRLDLQRAGFFGADAARTFLLLRTLSIIGLPAVGYVLSLALLPNMPALQRLLAMVILLVVGYVLPNAMLDRLKAIRMEEYRRTFPDLLDMLVVCVDAGLSFEGALQRLAVEFSTRSALLSVNLQLLGSELRAGRSISEALEGLSERLGLDEARSFAILLKQSLELGSDIGSALRVYSEEMREKRAAKAEEKANRLPVVMIIPLGLFIFPVIMMVILFPAYIRLTTTLKTFIGG